MTSSYQSLVQKFISKGFLLDAVILKFRGDNKGKNETFILTLKHISQE